MAACLIVTAPLELFLGARVYRRPGTVLKALLPPLVLFIAWDVLAIKRGVWSFSERHTLGWAPVGSVPVEELVFFVVVPLCALLTFEAVTNMRAKRRDRSDA